MYYLILVFIEVQLNKANFFLSVYCSMAVYVMERFLQGILGTTRSQIKNLDIFLGFPLEFKLSRRAPSLGIKSFLASP